jgi:methyl-accepting chemotaxis protein
MKLKRRLITINLGLISILSALVVAYILYNSYTTIKQERIEKIQMQTDDISNEIENILHDALHEADSLAKTLVHMKKSGGTDRTIVNELLQDVLDDPTYIHSWVAFEPNGFDENDDLYINSAGCDETGRLLSVIEKNGSGYIIGTCENIDNQVAYTITKSTKKKYITPPQIYKFEGKEIIAITFCEPIIIDNKFYGVTGVDISLNELAEINSEVKLFDNGFGRLVTDTGLVLAHPEFERVNKIGGEFEGEKGKEYLERISNGEKFLNESWSTSMGQDVFKYYNPINFEGSNLNWSYTTIVPKNELMAKVNKMIKLMIFLTVISVLFVGSVLYYNSKYVVDAFVKLSEDIVRLSKYDFTFDDSHKTIKYQKRKDETGQMANALLMMRNNFINLIKQVQDVAGHVSASSEQLTATAEQLSNSSDEVSRTIDELAKGAMNQADDTEIGSSKITDLGELINQNQTYMDNVNNSSNIVYRLVDEGLIVIKDLTYITGESGQAAREIFQIIDETNKSSEKIGKVSSVIASIAEQTNLLALNAAIEAARAGEVGKGFAVVAEEIRKLAEQSTSSTKEIDIIVNELLINSSSAVEKMKEVRDVVNKQVESVEQTEQKYNQISEAIGSTENAVERMNSSVEEMESRKTNVLDIIQSLSAIAQENAASTQEASASTQQQSTSIQEMANASENLSELAMELQQTISKFNI